jgi:hypothetical protein
VPQQLSGGLANEGQVVRIGDTVRRPAGLHSEAVTNLLDHLRRSGFDAAPAVLGKDLEGRDVYKWIDGDVPIPPFPAWALADEVLISTASLIRRLHDALSDFDFASPGRPVWDLAMAARMWIALRSRPPIARSSAHLRLGGSGPGSAASERNRAGQTFSCG